MWSIRPEYFAYFVDRYYYEVAKTGFQIYGSLGYFKEGIPPIKDIQNIDKIRASIGACSLKNWLLIRKLSLKFLPIGYGKINVF